MIRLSTFNTVFKDEDKMMVRYNNFEDICKILFPDKKLNENKKEYFYNALLNNDYDLFRNYSVLKKQLVINKILMELMNNINNDNINPFSDCKIKEAVKDINSLKDVLFKKGIYVKDFDIENYSLDDLRSYLYKEAGLKSKSIVEYYQNEVISENKFKGIKYDVGFLIKEGINPDAILHKEVNPYIDRNFLEENNFIRSYVKDGVIFGSKILKKDRKKRK